MALPLRHSGQYRSWNSARVNSLPSQKSHALRRVFRVLSDRVTSRRLPGS